MSTYAKQIAEAQRNTYSATQYPSDTYMLVNAMAFRPGELDKLMDNDRKLADCRARRKAAILRVSRMMQDEV